MARDLIVRYLGDASNLKASSAAAKSSLTSTAAAAEKMQQRYAAAVQVASRASKAAATAQAAAARKVGVEELKVQELRNSGKASAAQLAAANDRLATAQENLTRAEEKGQSAAKQLLSAQAAQAAAAKRTETQTSRAAASLGRLGGTFGRLGGSLRQARSNLDLGPVAESARRGLTGVATVAGVTAGALVAAGGAAVGYGIKIASGNEQAQISFSTMLGSAQKARDFLGQLQQFAATTPFEFPELQTAASSLIAAGFQAKQVIPIMRTLGDVTSGMGTGAEGVQRATVALQQMSAAGKITGEDLNQLRDAGVPVFDLLAKATGKSKAEVVKLANAGKLGKKELDQLFNALESGKGLERFSGLMDKQSQSLSGLASTLKDTLGQGLANAVAPTFPLIKQGFGIITGGATAFFGYLSKHHDDIASLVGSASKVLGSLSSVAKATFGGFSGSLSDGTDALSAFTDFVSTHQGDVTSFFVEGGHAALQLGIAVSESASTALKAYAGLATGVNKAGNAVMAEEARIVENFANLQEGLGFDGAAAKSRAAAKSIRDDIAANAASDPGKFARDLAGTLDNQLTPALKKADAGLTKMGKAQVGKAAQRDAAARTALAIDAIGTKANGAQIRLKKFSDISKLGASAQAGLRSRIKSAANALQDQIGAQQAAGAGQKALTKTWQTGRDRLAAEFRQMGLSKKAAQQLADKYAGVKPKVKTKFETPGLPGAKSGTDNYKGALKDVPGSKSTKFTTPGLAGAKSDAQSLDSTLRNMPKNIQIKINQAVATKGDRLAANRYAGGVWNGPDHVVKAATGRVLPGWSPGRDIHRFYSATAGELDLSGGEAVMVPQFTRAVGGPSGVDRLNRQARNGELDRALAGGGVPALVAVPDGPAAATALATRSTSSAGLSQAQVDQLAAALRDAVSDLGVHVVADSRGMGSLIRAEIDAAARKRKS